MHETNLDLDLDPSLTRLDLPSPVPDVFDLYDMKQDLFDLEKDITGQPLMCSSPRRPAIPLERLPTWPPSSSPDTDPLSPNSAVIQTDIVPRWRGAGVQQPAGQYNLPLSAVYNPAACGCFFNKHAIVHMLGLCRFSKFRSKCSQHKTKKSSSKKKRVELDYGFLERNHMKIYDINRGLKSPQHKHAHHHHRHSKDFDALQSESMRKRTMSLESNSTLRKSRPVKRSVSRQSLSANAGALARLKQSIRMHKNTRYKDGKHHVLSRTSRPGTCTSMCTNVRTVFCAWHRFARVIAILCSSLRVMNTQLCLIS